LGNLKGFAAVPGAKQAAPPFTAKGMVAKRGAGPFCLEKPPIFLLSPKAPAALHIGFPDG